MPVPFASRPPEWTSLPFGPFCSAYGAPFGQPSYWKDPLGRVHLKGLMAGPAGYAGGVLFTLPAGHRPAAAALFSVIASYASGNLGFRLNIWADGTGTIDTSSGVGWNGGFLSLEGIQFQAA